MTLTGCGRHAARAARRVARSISLADALAALAHIEKTQPVGRIDELVTECLPVARMLAQPDMNTSKYTQANIVCPLLQNSLCSVYPVRPVICRAHTSFDPAEKCSTPGAFIKQAPAGRINCEFLPLSISIMEDCGLPNPSGPLQYMLLTAVYVVRSDGKWRELAHTPLLDMQLAICSWAFLESANEAWPRIHAEIVEQFGYLPKPYPVWELFPEAAATR